MTLVQIQTHRNFSYGLPVCGCGYLPKTGSDVVKSALLGADSYEFGTTALMMLKCVMAKNCNIKCPAGLTTNPEIFDGDPRSLAQYFINVAHEVREILSFLGIKLFGKYSIIYKWRCLANLLGF